MNWLLIVVLIIFFGSILTGHKQGFFRTLFSIGSIIIAIILTTILAPYIAVQINKNEAIQKSVREQVGGLIDLIDKNASDEEQEVFIDNMKVPSYVKKYLKTNNNLQVYEERGINSFNEYIVDGIVRLIISLITYVVILFVIRIAVFVIAIMASILSSLPVVEENDGVGGGLVGAVKGLMEVWILFIIITMIIHTELGSSAMACINNNVLLREFYNNNVILNIMYQFI